jgi:hypothetical protein
MTGVYPLAEGARRSGPVLLKGCRNALEMARAKSQRSIRCAKVCSKPRLPRGRFMPTKDSSTAYIIHDDRADAWPGIAIAIASITRFHPEADLIVSFPNSAALCDQQAFPKERILHRNLRHAQATSFNLKPAAMMTILDAGYGNVIWFDSDII